VLVKDRLALESMRTVNTVLFDKTGTLTRGEPVVSSVFPAGGWTPDRVLALAAAAESDSEHPLARAIVRAASHLELSAATDFRSSPAEGVSATVGGASVAVGGPYLLERRGLEPLPSTRDASGGTLLHVIVDGEVVGALALADEVRAESIAAVQALHERGIQVVMITGDAEPVAQRVADAVGIDRVFAGVRPEDKSARVAQLQSEGRRVA